MAERLLTCPACAGFAPATSLACPHCDAALITRPRHRLARMLATMIGSGALAVTLMACYGAMPHHAEYAQGNCQNGGVDQDGDGTCAPQDCNDADQTIYPNAADPDLDAIDQNCDGADGWRDPATVAEPAPVTEPVTPAEPEPVPTP